MRICKNALKERCSQHRDWDEGCFLFEVNGLILRIYTDCLFSDSVLSNCHRKLQLCLSWLSRFSYDCLDSHLTYISAFLL